LIILSIKFYLYTFTANNKRKKHQFLCFEAIGLWKQYARWEANAKEFERARSIYERVLKIDYKIHNIWLVYAEMEMVNGFVARARNVWNRAVQLLPRVDQLWCNIFKKKFFFF